MRAPRCPRRVWLLIPLVALAAALASLSGSGRSQAAARRPMVVFFGDSLTAGLHATDPSLTYRQLVLSRLAQTPDGGQSFAFIQDPYGLLDDAQTKVPLVLAAQPTLIFLELGHHEIWSNQTEVDRFESRYTDILDRLLRSGADVVPSTLAWLGSAPGSFAYRATLQINAVIRRVAEDRGLIVADLWTVTNLRQDLLSTSDDFSFVAPYQGDSLHPNDAGHRALADAFWRAYRQMRQNLAQNSGHPK